MATIMIGSARYDENGKYTGGAAGDQLQSSSTNDTVGEVSMQSYYTHSKGWNILRTKSVSHANAIAEKMKTACNNANIGYDQGNRNGIVTYGTGTSTKTECDCSSLVRVVVKEATGKDPGNFTTANEKSVLLATGLFDDKGAYTSGTVLYNGDILITKSKGHTCVVVSGNARSSGSTSASSTGYTKTQFIKDVQTAIGTTVDGIAGSKTLAATPTLSATKNRKHAAVKPVQKYLYALGYTSVGTADGIAGSKFTTAVKAYQKANGCTVDGEITAKAKTWKKLLGLA